MHSIRLRIKVIGFGNRTVKGCRIIAVAVPSSIKHVAKHSGRENIYELDDLPSGSYQLQVSAEGFMTQKRHVKLSTGEQEVEFILATKDTPYYHSGKIEVPFEPLPKIAISYSGTREDEDFIGMQETCLKLGFEENDAELECLTDENVVVLDRPSSMDDDQLAEAIVQLAEQHKLIQNVGCVLEMEEDSLSFLSSQIVIKLTSGGQRGDLDRIIAEFNLEVVRNIPYVSNTWLLNANIPATLKVVDISNRLNKLDIVEYAEANLFHALKDQAINPTDYLYPEQWHIPIVNLPDAWQDLQDANPVGVNPGDANDMTFGSTNVVLAILDRGIQSNTNAGVTSAIHPDFSGNLTDGNPKVSQFFDFAQMVPNNDNPPNDHGMGCGGAATAMTNNASGVVGVNEGVTGASPNCSLMGCIRPAGGGNIRYSDAFMWMAGFNPGWVIDGVNYLAGTVFPALPANPAQLISCSFGWGSGVLNGLMQDAFDTLTTYGRGGKGVSVFWASGNQTAIPPAASTYSTAIYPKVFAVGASSLANDGITETLSGYSKIGNHIEWCAPSHSAYPILHNPPASYGVISADLLNAGNMPGNPANQTTLTADVAASAVPVALQVASSAGFLLTDVVMVGAPGTAGAESQAITGIPDGTTIQVAQLFNNHLSGDAVEGGPANYKNNFGGTSSATPLSAGIAALVLSAQPQLTWVELRDVLRGTATKFDFVNNTPTGQWLDSNGNPSNISLLPPLFSQWYGYGRIDAAAAVTAAINYTFPRDLMVRDELADTGVAVSVNFNDSPDIWVRNEDPSTDLAALPGAYSVAGPHLDPEYGSDHWVYVRVKNRGVITSSDAWLRIYIAHSDGTPLNYPQDWIPVNGAANPTPNIWNAGTYLMSEIPLPNIAAGDDFVVNIPWPADLFPPPITSGGVPWVPVLLAEVSPHDGTVTGNTVELDNNLAQKLITIVDNTPPVVEYLDNASDLLPRAVPIPTGSDLINLPFTIKITDPGFVTVEDVTLTFTWTSRDGTITAINFADDGTGTWVPDNPTPTNTVISQPVDGAAVVVTGNTTEAYFNCTLDVIGEYTEILLQVNVQDLSANVTPLVESSILLDVTIPTDVMLLLDYSGSMLKANDDGQTKWSSAKEAANLFNVIYAALSPATLGNQIGYVRFFTDGFAGPDQTEVTAGLAAASTAAPLVDVVDPNLFNWTPIGSSIVAAHGEMAPLPPPGWRNRVMILMTDGKENRPPMLEELRSALEPDPNYVPNLGDNIQLGYRIHACAFGSDADIDTDALQYLVMGGDGIKSYDGQLHTTASTSDPDDAFALKEQFISMIADTLTADIIGPVFDEFEVEPGVSKMVCLVTNAVNFTITPPPEHVALIDAVTLDNGFAWVKIIDPAPGTWELGNFAFSDTVKGFAIVDLALKADFDVSRTNIGVGLPIEMEAIIRKDGIGISGAEVDVEIIAPGESAGEVISAFTASKQFERSQWVKIRDNDLQENISSLKRQLLDSAIKLRKQAKHVNQNIVHLTENSTGVYTGAWPSTFEEGTYTFRFSARGITHSGYAFERFYVVSRYIAPVPEPSFSSVTLQVLGDLKNKLTNWRLSFIPKTQFDRAIGAGASDKYQLAFQQSKFAKKQAANKEIREQELQLIDQLDGSYSIDFALPKEISPEQVISLSYGQRSLPLKQFKKALNRVKVTLQKVKILDDKETWFPAPGEVVFNSLVVPGNDKDRAVRRRIPDQKHLQLMEGQVVEVDVVLFDQYVAEGDSLDIVIGGTELDSFFFFKKKDHYARYQRTLSGSIASWAGEYQPDDEDKDPEKLADWEVWYEIQII